MKKKKTLHEKTKVAPKKQTLVESSECEESRYCPSKPGESWIRYNVKTAANGLIINAQVFRSAKPSLFAENVHKIRFLIN